MHNSQKIITPFDVDDLRYAIKETRTPMDGRTFERKQIVARTKEVKPCEYWSQYGYFAWCSTRFIYACQDHLLNKN